MRNQELQCGAIGEAHQSLEDARASAVETPRWAHDFVRWDDWLRECFSDARLPDVARRVKLFERGAVASHGWSLTPGRYVGVAPDEEDEDFDFEEEVRSIHIDLKGINKEATALAARIARNFQALGA